jgi:peroxiredoxin Q/BCP
VVSKEGKVLLAEPGSPQGTVDAVKKIVKALKEGGKEDEAEKVEQAAETTD